MKLLRLMFSLVLMLAIPFLGTPALAMPQIPPCPMQSDMTHSMGMQADHDDCCQMDKMGSQKSSKAKSATPCKPGQECKLGQVFSPLASLAFQPLPVSAVVAIYPDTVIRSHDPSGLWRPPQL